MDQEEANELLKHAQDLSKISQAFYELTEGLKYEDRIAILVSLMMQNVLNHTDVPGYAMAETANIFSSMIFTLKKMADVADFEEDEEEEIEETKN
jgi:hypothetical protein